MNNSNIIELALLEPTATLAQLENICNKAIGGKSSQITVPPLMVKKAKELLAQSSIRVSTVIGYPYGWSSIESKVAETILAMVDGADELEVVTNITALKNNDWQYLAKELNTLMTVIKKQQRSVNIIIEVELLDKEDITRCCDLYGVAGIDCLGISTGTHAYAPAFEKLRWVRSQLAEQVNIKVTGYNFDQATIDLYRQAGAARIGMLVK